MDIRPMYMKEFELNYTRSLLLFQVSFKHPMHVLQETRMQVSRCFFPNPRSTFITTSERLRSLPLSEYMWLREWIQSWQEDGGGIFRRLMGERLWPVLLGCPEDIHHNTSDGGCHHNMHFASGKAFALLKSYGNLNELAMRYCTCQVFQWLAIKLLMRRTFLSHVLSYYW